MFEELRRKFQRFFFLDPTELRRSILGAISSNPFKTNLIQTFFTPSPQVEQGELVEIIKDRIYLSHLPHQPFLGHHIPDDKESALLVSCLEIEEIARSKLLLEPNPSIKYHVLPLDDITAEAGCIEHVIDTLLLMSRFDDANKKIQVHSLAGVYRNAIMVALYLSYRYLLGDKKVVESLNGRYPLDPTDLKMIYRRASTFVSDKEPRSELDTWDNPEWVQEVLLKLKHRSKPVADENYSFLAKLVQSAGFKKMQYYYYLKFDDDLNYSASIQNFFDNLIMNRDGWYEQLCAFYHNGCQDEERCSVLSGVLKEINDIAERYPNSFYAQHVKNAPELNQTPVPIVSCNC